MGRGLCVWCGNTLPEENHYGVVCGAECSHEWRIRTSRKYARKEVYKRDGGVCAKCGVDTRAIARDLIARYGKHHFMWTRDSHLAKQIELLGITPHTIAKIKDEGCWDADHITPVTEGGGSCGIEGYRTLCLPCHNVETQKLRARLRKRAAAEKTNDRDGPAVT